MSPVSLLAVGIGVILLVIVWIAVGVWVVLDARARGSSDAFLYAELAVFSGIFLLYYVFSWRRQHNRKRPPSSLERYAAVIAVSGIGGATIAVVAAPPDPFTQLLVWPIMFVCCLPVIYWLTGRTQIATRNTA